MIRSIFSRLLVSYIVVILLSTATLGALMSFLVRGYVVDNKRQEMMARGETVAVVVAPSVNSGRITVRLDLLGDFIGTKIWVVNRQGEVLAGDLPPRWSRAFPEDSPQIEALFAGTPQSWVRNARRQADPSIIVAVPVRATPPAAVFLYTPITGVNLAIQSMDRLLLISLLVGMLAAAIFGFLISRGLTQPIANITQAAARFAAGDYTSRTAATGKDEVGGLGRTFNAMAESLAATEQNRREFLANASHELKTPVASIQALAEALHDGVAGPELQPRYLATIVAESEHIDRLIHDLLDLSQLEAGELTIIPGKVDLPSFLAGEATKYDHLLTPKGLELRRSLPDQLPAVLADGGRLAQVMTNLVSNAARYSPTGSVIEITARTEGSKVAVAVTDHGPGVPAADQPYIWDRFYRVDKSRARNGGGTGLGLAITKQLVQAMGGDVALHSVPGEGATFTFTLPVAE